MLVKTAIFVIAFVCFTNGQENKENKARYDNYRLYRVQLKTDDQVKLFQEIEANSDSYSFIGHARKPNQNLSILVAAHKIAELTDIMNNNKIGYEILVSEFTY